MASMKEEMGAADPLSMLVFKSKTECNIFTRL